MRFVLVAVVIIWKFTGASVFPGWAANHVLQVNGRDDYVEFANKEALNSIKTQLTVEAWIKVMSFENPGWTTFFSKEDIHLQDGYLLALAANEWAPNGGGSLYLLSGLKGSKKMVLGSPPGLIEQNRWYHIAATIDAKSGLMKLYINGTEINREDYELENISAGSKPLIIGRGTFQIDEIRVWNTSRTEKQIRSAMCRTLAGNEPGLVGYWRFEDPGKIATDSSTSGISGRLSGNAHFVEEDLPKLSKLAGPKFISNWLLLGAFNEGRKASEAIDVDYLKKATGVPEKNFSTLAGAPKVEESVSLSLKGEKSQKRSWEIQRLPQDGDITRTFEEKGNTSGAVAYLVTFVKAEATTKRNLMLSFGKGSFPNDFGARNYVKVWLNGRLLRFHAPRPESIAESNVATITLKEGINCLLFKLAHNDGGWRLKTWFDETDDLKYFGSTGEINTVDEYSTVLVNQEGHFLLTLDIKEASHRNPVKEIQITLPASFQSSGACVSGGVRIGTQTIGAKSVQEGLVLKVILDEPIRSGGRVEVGFEAVAGPSAVESVAFSVRLLRADGTVLVDQLEGGDVNNIKTDLNGLNGIAIINNSPIPPPKGLRVMSIPGENDMRISWESSGREARAYKIYANNQKLGKVVGRDTTRYTHVSAEPGSRISYNVVSVASAQLKSNPSEVVTATAGKDTTPPQSPPLIVKRIDKDNVKLTWTETGKDAVQYTIYRGTSRDDLKPLAQTEPTEREYTDATRENYVYAVEVQDDQGNTSGKPLKIYPFFSDTSAAAGVKTLGRSHGVSFVDYDNDGKVDILVSEINGTTLLYHNNGNGTFTDESKSAGLTAQGTYYTSSPFGDFDNDGNLDLYVADFRGADVFYKSRGGEKFTEATAGVGLGSLDSSMCAAWADYDNDGFLDIYLSKGDYFQPSAKYPNLLYRNTGNGAFVNVAQEASAADAENGRGVAWGDYDNDNHMDLYVANYMGGANALYRNTGDGTFTNVTEMVGVSFRQNSHGVVFADYDNDLDLDIFVTNDVLYNEGANLLYRNNGDGTFEEVSVQSGIADDRGTCGIAVGDLDNDGDLDVFTTSLQGSNTLYSNNGDGTFTDITEEAGIGEPQGGAGVALGDYDADGFLDIYVANYSGEQPDALYRNNGNDNHWLHIKTVGTVSNRDGIGTRVVVIAGGVAQLRQVNGGSGYCSQDSLPVEFGLGQNDKADLVKVFWPSGSVQKLTDIPADQLLTVMEEK